MPAIPRLPLVPDPLRRIRMPKDLDAVTTFGPEEAAAAGGMGQEAVEKIWDAVVHLYRAGVHPAAQFCLRRNGEIVLNRAIGHAHGNGPSDGDDAPKVPATPETPQCVFSTSKAITATVVHMLVERGLIEIEAPIAEYIPGYERHGKDKITVGHVLAHRAGVQGMPREALDLDRANDRDFIVELLCDAKPSLPPGWLLAYHAVSGGFILGEVVHRVTGVDIRTVLAREILDPLGFRWGNYGVAEEDVPVVSPGYITGAPLLPPLSSLITRALGAPFDEVVRTANDPRFLTSIVPAANVVTNAVELSRFFELLRRGGELDGVRVMEAKTVERALEQQSHLELDLSLGFPTRFSYGFMLGARLVSLLGRDTDLAFGHLGFVNTMGWADPERGLSAALLTNGKPVLYPEMARFLGVMQRVASEVPKADARSRAW
jgi:CubicO group peptidase (beta-lactamase class C family)